MQPGRGIAHCAAPCLGAYCILLVHKDDPETIIAARKGSPLVIGIGKAEHFLASDASPIIEYTKEVVYVNDYEIAIVKPDELILKTSAMKANAFHYPA